MIGEACALASAACFAFANITITRGAGRGASDNGAFLSLIITTLVAGLAWLAFGVRDGFPSVRGTALLWFAVAGIFTAFIGRVFLYASIQHLGAVRASAIKRLNPFFAVLVGVIALREAVTPGMALGMGLILASFGLLVRGAFHGSGDAAVGNRWAQLRNLGYLYGPVSALGYAVGYLFRKLGLAETPDAYLGTMVGTLTGALVFVGAGAFRASYAKAVKETLRRANPWLYAAGLMSSLGQILYFVALRESPMSKVALIASMEVFVTLFLSVAFLRRHEPVTAVVWFAAALGVAGTALIAGF